MGLPTHLSRFEDDGVIKAPQIEWVKNDPKTTKHLPCPDSSWLESISYDPNTLRLTVTTKKGDSWQHGQVYPNQFEELSLHSSKGSYYTKNIKGNHATTTILKTPKLKNFPKETTHAPQSRFAAPKVARNSRYSPRYA